MSFQAKLFLGDDGLEFTVITAEYTFFRKNDDHYRPTGRLNGGLIELTIETGSSGDLVKWINQNLLMNGKIDYYRRDAANSSQKTINFKNAYCLYLKDSFISNGISPMITHLKFSCHEMEINNNTHINTWAGFDASEGSSSSQPKNSDNGNTVSFDDSN